MTTGIPMLICCLFHSIPQLADLKVYEAISSLFTSIPFIPILDSGNISMVVIMGGKGSAVGEVTNRGCLWLDLQLK